MDNKSNEYFFELPRKNDIQSKEKRQNLIEKMSIKDLNNEIINFEHEINDLKKLKSTLNDFKTMSFDKDKNFQKQQNQLDNNIKLFKVLINTTEQSKNILLNIQRENIDLSTAYKDYILTKSNENNLSKIKNKMNELIINTNQNLNNRVNILPKNFDYLFIKDKLTEFSNNDSLDINIDEILVFIKDFFADEENNNFYPLFSSLGNFGVIKSGSHYNNENKLSKYLEFIGKEENTSWREISSSNKSRLSLAFNNLLQIHLICKDNNESNSKSIISLISESSDIIEKILKAQIISLSKKETEIGIKNTLLTILCLSCIFEPFFGISTDLESNNKICLFEQRLDIVKENIKVLKNNIEITLNNLNISNTVLDINKEFITKATKLFINSLNFSSIEKDDLFFLKRYFNHFKNEPNKLNMFIKNVEKTGFNVLNIQNIDEIILSYLPIFNIEEKKLYKRNFNTFSSFFDFFLNNNEYVKTLNNKIELLYTINKFKIHIYKTSFLYDEIFYLDVLELITNNFYTNQISHHSMNLIFFFIEVIDLIQNALKIKEKEYSEKVKAFKVLEIKDTKSLLEETLREVTVKIDFQRSKHESKSQKIKINENDSFENLRALIPNFQKEIQVFISGIEKIIFELENEKSNRKSLNNNQSKPYTQPKLKNNIFSKPEQSNINTDNSKEILNYDSIIDVKKTNMGKLDINQILKDLNIKKDEK